MQGSGHRVHTGTVYRWQLEILGQHSPGVPVRSRVLRIEGTISFVECLSNVINTDLKCPLTLAIWEVPPDPASLTSS